MNILSNAIYNIYTRNADSVATSFIVYFFLASSFRYIRHMGGLVRGAFQMFY